MTKRTQLEETSQEPGYQSGGESISGRPTRIIVGRRPHRAVLAESFGKAIVEESQLHNNPNGDAGITNGGRFIRVLVKGTAYFMHQNSINLSKRPGAKWKRLGPIEVLRDQGTSCLVDCPEDELEKCCGDPTF
jgi:hypothetical protein